MKYEELPLKTSTGVRIGGSYKPPALDYNSSEDVFWQSIMLDIEPELSERRVIGWVLYCLAVVAFMLLLKNFL
jgi:hypothetical protein